MASVRIIDSTLNDIQIERIRVTFDQVAGNCQNTLRPINLPEDCAGLKGKDGDFFYGISEEGVEGVAIIHEMGVAIIYRNGETSYPDGMELPEKGEESEYDYYYSHFDLFLRTTDMPDKIEEPLEDEIDIEAGFGDADEDGEPIDPDLE